MANLDKDYYLDKDGVQTLISELETNTLADEYSSSATYAVGDYCVHDNKVYRCTTAISTAEAWTGAHWTYVIISDELKTKKSGTVTSITIKGTSPIVSSSSSAITTSGTRTISHANSGVTAGDYGDISDQTPSYGGTFKVPSLSVNATGHVTVAGEHTVTIPASDNTDQNVLQSVLSDTDATNWRKIAIGFYNNANPATTATEQTNKIWVSNKLEYQASKGMLSVGISTDDGVFPNGGIKCHDVRDVTTVPSQEGVNFIMTNNDLSGWWSGLHFKSSGGTYAAWELVGYANNGDGRTQPLYVRTSNKTTAWGDWRKLYDTSNPPTASEVGALPSTTTYAGSSTVGGSATSAVKLDTATAGSATQPCYFANGQPSACTYSLNKTVPDDAKFTDTTYSAGTGLSLSGTTINHSNSITAKTTQAVYPVKIDAQGHITAVGTAATILALGTGASNAYYGDKGNTAYTHATDSSRLTTATESGLYKVASTAQGHIASLTAVEKADITALGIPGSDTDTKNTAGADNTTSKIFLVGSTAQTSSNGSARTYSNVNCYASGGKLYSNGSAVLTSHQSVNDGNPTLDWGTQSTVATIGSTDIHVNLPANPNTDANVYQSNSTTANWRKIVLSYQNDETVDTAISAATNQVYVNRYVQVQPSTGTIKAPIVQTTGNLIVAPPADNATFPTGGIKVHDLRGIADTVPSLASGVTFFFSNNTMPTANWYSGIYVKGYSSTYAPWEVVGYAANGDGRSVPLYVRTANKTTAWSSWRKIYDESNPPTALEVGAATSDHVHGSITNAGAITGTTALADGDGIIFADSNDSSKLKRSSITFDGSTTTKCLTQKGTWESFTNNAGTITSVKTTAGAHTTINVSSGAVEFNVPTVPNDLLAFDAGTTGIALASGDNVDTLTEGKTYTSSGSTISGNLTGTPPTTSSGFKILTYKNYSGSNHNFQFATKYMGRTKASGTLTDMGKIYVRHKYQNDTSEYLWSNWYIFYTSETLKNESASSGGNTLSLVTTGDKYTWNNKADADEKTKQTLTSDNYDRPLLLSSTTKSNTTTDIYNGSFRNNSIYANASTGTITATKFVGDISDGTGLTSSQVTTALGYTPSQTDEKVKQSNTTSKNWRKLALGSQEGSSLGTATAETTSQVYVTPELEFCPDKNVLSVGAIRNYYGAIQTGETKASHITLQTLMTWLISTQKWIPNNFTCHLFIHTTTTHTDNDILQFTAHGTNYECQLSGCHIEFMGYSTGYNAGQFRLIIHNAPKNSFTVAEGYTKMPVSSIAEYWCTGSSNNPVWKLYSFGGKTISTTSIGSASTGTAIPADDITSWTTNTPTAVTPNTVVTSATYSSGVLTIATGDSCTVTAGTSADLQYASKTIPNISVSSVTVATAT